MQVMTTDTAASVELSAACFERDFNEALVHQSVVAHLAGARSGTRAQKGRSEVRGGGIKPFRQKGTGRARAGTIRSPLWRGGGKVFAAGTRDFSQKMNRKMYRAAIASILSELLRQDRLRVVENFVVESGRTRDAVAAIGKLGIESGLIVVGDVHANTWLAVRNLPRVNIVTAAEINPGVLVAAENVVITTDAVKRVEEWLA